jgi:DNA polymerase-3 subunit gamma/tau
VDAIRELRESVGYMPSSGKFKVYIIDEVHMLSTAAFNALLKTLEEPPGHVVFILATTEAQKIPNTILSRCQRFDFRRIPSRQIAEQLLKICHAENVQASPEAVWAIARQADGSMRDSQSLLDQVITFSNKEISLEKVIDVLGLTDRQLVIDGATALVRRDSHLALQLIEKVHRTGVDPKIFAQDLLEEIRNTLMVHLCNDDPARVVDLSDSEIQALATLARESTEEDLHALFDMMLKGVSDLLRASDPRLVLEMVVLRVAASPSMMSLRELFQPGRNGFELKQHAQARVERSKAVSPNNQNLVSQSNVVTSAAEKSEVSQASENFAGKYSADSFTRPAKPGGAKTFGQKTAEPPRPVVTALPPENTNKSQIPNSEALLTSDSSDAPQASDPWQLFVYRVRKSNGLLGAMLENTHVIEQTQANIILGVPKKVGFVLDKLRDSENLKRIEQFIETFWQKQLKVEVRLLDGQSEALTPKAKEEQARSARKQSIEAAVEQNPLVRTAKNVFKTQVKAIRDLDKPSKS